MTHFCSFCGKSQHEVPILIHLAEAKICNECVEFRVAVMALSEPAVAELAGWDAAQ
jgi:ATP-dependent protease Clp ATPase subunit